MLSVEAQDTIARFLGLFSVEEFDPKLRAKVYAGTAHEETVQPHRLSDDAPDAPGSTASPSVHLPHLRYANDHFEIVEAATKGLHSSPVDVSLDPLHVGARAYAPMGSVTEPSALFADSIDRAEHARMHGVDRHGGHAVPPPDPTFAYRDIPSDSLLANTVQGNLLDDRDTLILDPDGQPLEPADAVSQRFEAMVELGAAAHSLPEIPHDAAGWKAMLATSAFEHRGEPGQADGPAGHEGVYVDGKPAAEMPDLHALIEQFTDETPDEAPSSLDTGSNLLRNEAGVLTIADLGRVSIVEGNWHETNSIRQINLYADGDEMSGVLQAGGFDAATRSLNVARFERIDATPGAHPTPGPLPAFATHYQVDILQGDLQITNILSQLNFTLDGDRIVLGTLHSDATLASGGNEATNFADILKSLGEYDLVIVGGSVFEGNFIQQINILSDQDRIAGDVAARTGGNLLLNNAHITNYGAIGDFTAMTPHMRDLVASFEARAATGTADLGADLAFLQSQHIKVLYIAGDVYETNIVSQMNVLDDSDTVLAPHGALARFVEAAGPNAAWSISTGHNGLINNASIVDVDDASHLRFVGGEYYSDSMLLQAGLVSPQTDVMTFDVNSLAPELIAFMTHLDPGDPGTGADHQHHGFETHADGVAGILA